MEPSEIQEEIQREFEELSIRFALLVARAKENGLRIGFVPIAAPIGVPRPEPPTVAIPEPPVAVISEPPASVPIVSFPIEPAAGADEPACAFVSYPARDAGSAQDERAGWHDALRDELPGFRHPPEAMNDEADELYGFVRNERRLGAFPNGIQVLLLQYVVARTRHRQDEGLDGHRALSIISAVGKYSGQTRVGFVYGAMRTHVPQNGTWKNDARAYLIELSDAAAASTDGTFTPGRLVRLLETCVENAEPCEDVFDALDVAVRGGVAQSDPRVVRLLAPYLADLAATGQYKTLRSAIRTANKKSLPVEDPIAEPARMLNQWPWLPFTRGKRAVIVGGDPREPNRVRIQLAFGFAELAWESSAERTRMLAQVRDRVANGGVDLVIVLRRFIGHDVDNVVLPACRVAGIAWVSVPTGYGISRIRQEIERMVPLPG